MCFLCARLKQTYNLRLICCCNSASAHSHDVTIIIFLHYAYCNFLRCFFFHTSPSNLYIIYIYIYIVVVQVIRIMLYFCRKTIHYFKSIYKHPEKSWPARTGPFVPPAPGCSPNVTFSHVSAPACHKPLQQSHVSCSFFFCIFSKCHWRPHFSYVFDIGSSCHGSCDPSPVPKNCLQSNITHISNEISMFLC